MAGELESSLHEDRDKKHLYKYTVEHSVGLDHIKEHGPALLNQVLDKLIRKLRGVKKAANKGKEQETVTRWLDAHDYYQGAFEIMDKYYYPRVINDLDTQRPGNKE